MKENSADMTEKENNKVRGFLLKPGFQLEYRHALSTVYALKELPKEANKQRTDVLTKFGQETSFLSIFSLFYEIYRYVRKIEMQRRKEWYWNQIEKLGYLILLDLFHPEKATPTEAEKKSNKKQNNSATNFSRVRSSYPELFFAASKAQLQSLQKGRKRRTDKRLSRYSTVFSEIPRVDEECDRETAQALLMAETAAAFSTMSPQEIENRKELTAGFRMVDPDDMVGLQEFWKMQTLSLEVITSNYGQPTQNAWLIQHIKKGSILIESIYQLVDKAVALKWYRTIKSERRKAELFKEKHPPRYSKEDAKIAIEANLKWFCNPIKVVDLAFRGANAYSQIGRIDISLILYKECLEQIPMDSKDKGLCYHNIAITYRDLKKPRKYLGYLKKALRVFEELGPFDVGITYANIAEAYHLMGNYQEFEKAKKNSMKILASTSLSDKQRASAFLQVADCATIIRDFAWENEALKLGLTASDKAENPYAVSYFIQRLTDLEQGKNTLLAEREPGKLKRPSVFPWIKDAASYFAPPPETNKDYQ